MLWVHFVRFLSRSVGASATLRSDCVSRTRELVSSDMCTYATTGQLNDSRDDHANIGEAERTGWGS